MNDLARYFEQNTALASSIDSCAHPLDALYRINPEIASLAYANKEQWLTPEVLPTIGLFRKMQRDEKIAVLDTLVNKLGIESDERKHELLMHTNLDIRQMECDTERYGIDSDERKHSVSMHTAEKLGTMKYDVDKLGIQSEERKHQRSMNTIEYVTELQEAGATERTGIMANTAFELQKIKYEADVRIVEQHMTGEKYLSDNELRATYIEAQALRDIIIFTEKTRADTQGKEIDARVKEQISKAEFNYLIKIKEAEELRKIEDGRNNAVVTQAYITTQGQIMREALLVIVQQDNNRVSLTKKYLTEQRKITQAALVLEGSKTQAGTLSEQAAFKTLEVITGECAGIFKKGDVKSIKITYETTKGPVSFYMEAEKNGR